MRNKLFTRQVRQRKKSKIFQRRTKVPKPLKRCFLTNLHAVAAIQPLLISVVHAEWPRAEICDREGGPRLGEVFHEHL
jgi:hypothetical protein